MSQRCRAEAAKLRAKYARVFDLPLDSVSIREESDDDAVIYAPSRPDLPQWRTGSLP